MDEEKPAKETQGATNVMGRQPGEPTVSGEMRRWYFKDEGERFTGSVFLVSHVR